MDENRSTTPPLPPPEPSETLQPDQPAHAHARHESPPPSAQREAQEVSGKAMELEAQSPEPRMDPSRQNSKLPRPAHSRTPEPLRAIQISSHQTYSAGLAHAAHLAPERSSTPDTPGAGNLSPFDWDDLEARFEKALASANQHENELMAEFESLVKASHNIPDRLWRGSANAQHLQYFKIWASTAAAHDNERASKRWVQTRRLVVLEDKADVFCSRLQTRTHFVKLREEDLASKKQNCKFASHNLVLISERADLCGPRRTSSISFSERHGTVAPGPDLTHFTSQASLQTFWCLDGGYL